jgi:hypothetical protein
LSTAPFPLPFLDHGGDPMRMGLAGIDARDWLDRDDKAAAEIALKRALLATKRGDVLRVLPEGEAASRELAGAVAVYLGRATSSGGDGEAALEAAALWVQDDLCLLAAEASGAYRLVAAALCFPSRWSLAEKIGRPIRAIHDPVPGLNDRLGDSIDRFLERLKPGRVYRRFNWGLSSWPELHQPPEAPRPPVSAERAGTALFLRTERQTLRRLPQSGAICFTIRVRQHALDEVAAIPGALAALDRAAAGLDPALLDYKGLPALIPALAGYAARRALNRGTDWR